MDGILLKFLALSATLKVVRSFFNRNRTRMYLIDKNVLWKERATRGELIGIDFGSVSEDNYSLLNDLGKNPLNCESLTQ